MWILALAHARAGDVGRDREGAGTVRLAPTRQESQSGPRGRCHVWRNGPGLRIAARPRGTQRPCLPRARAAVGRPRGIRRLTSKHECVESSLHDASSDLWIFDIFRFGIGRPRGRGAPMPMSSKGWQTMGYLVFTGNLFAELTVFLPPAFM